MGGKGGDGPGFGAIASPPACDVFELRVGDDVEIEMEYDFCDGPFGDVAERSTECDVKDKLSLGFVSCVTAELLFFRDLFSLVSKY